MQNTSEASRNRMGMLNNSLTEEIDSSKVTPLEAIAVLRLLLARLERSFEMSVMSQRVERKK